MYFSNWSLFHLLSYLKLSLLKLSLSLTLTRAEICAKIWSRFRIWHLLSPASMSSLIQSSRLSNIDVIVENTSCHPSRFFIRTEEQADQFFTFNRELQNFYWKWVSSEIESENEEGEKNERMLYYTNSLFVAYHQVRFVLDHNLGSGIHFRFSGLLLSSQVSRPLSRKCCELLSGGLRWFDNSAQKWLLWHSGKICQSISLRNQVPHSNVQKRGFFR